MTKKELSTYDELLQEDPQGLRREELIIEATEALAKALRGSGLTQTELAQRLGKTKGFVSQILGGGKNLTLRTIADVAGALGCTVQIQLRPEKEAAKLRFIEDWNQRPASYAEALGPPFHEVDAPDLALVG
jgi:transcriptional regulator with XRE-family HTH domain